MRGGAWSSSRHKKARKRRERQRVTVSEQNIFRHLRSVCRISLRSCCARTPGAQPLRQRADAASDRCGRSGSSQLEFRILNQKRNFQKRYLISNDLPWFRRTSLHFSFPSGFLLAVVFSSYACTSNLLWILLNS